MIQDHLDHSASKEPMNSTLDKDSSVLFMHHDPSYLRSLILIQIIVKECTLK